MILTKFSKRERILVSATIAITLATISYGFIIEPVIATYSKINRQIRSNTLKLEKGYRLLRRANEIKAEYRKYADLVKPLPSDEEEIAAMLKAIEAIARGNNIYITNIRPQPARENEYYKEFIFELTAEAGVERLGKFIYDIQSSGNLLRVRKLTLNSSSKERSLKAVMEISKSSIPAIEL
ncbi:type 4a pilus biogenesis protein PilO [Omnitrophica bacterium]|nr:type 4a pilus biogenesis protein PilO [Candidatus Omnitrophota bacterium]